MFPTLAELAAKGTPHPARPGTDPAAWLAAASASLSALSMADSGPPDGEQPDGEQPNGGSGGGEEERGAEAGGAGERAAEGAGARRCASTTGAASLRGSGSARRVRIADLALSDLMQSDAI